MGNIDEKVEYYYDQVMHIYRTSYSRRIGWKDNNGARTKSNIRELIENGYEYLLTTSFLDFLAFDDIYRQETMDLKNDQYQLLRVLKNYFKKLFDGLSPYRRYSCIDTCVNTLDKDLKKDIICESDRVNRLGAQPGINGYCFCELYQIVHLVFAYYVINKRQADVHKLCDIFLNDIYGTYDKLSLNDVKGITIDFYHRNKEERFIQYVYCGIENQEENKGEGNKVIL